MLRGTVGQLDGAWVCLGSRELRKHPASERDRFVSRTRRIAGRGEAALEANEGKPAGPGRASLTLCRRGADAVWTVGRLEIADPDLSRWLSPASSSLQAWLWHWHDTTRQQARQLPESPFLFLSLISVSLRHMADLIWPTCRGVCGRWRACGCLRVRQWRMRASGWIRSPPLESGRKRSGAGSEAHGCFCAVSAWSQQGRRGERTTDRSGLDGRRSLSRAEQSNKNKTGIPAFAGRDAWVEQLETMRWGRLNG